MKRLNIILRLISTVLLIGPYAIIYVFDHGNPIMNARVRKAFGGIRVSGKRL
ncbi:hypothetical protein [Bacillus glycinifermentans]|uniref:Uncharacterized protein n=1 Tax=Bacillus glycinifermentans TaxID=1664069 RepID=A0ABU6H0F4_9BACI|nr:hypothetical protein [Bacillus glycinifermentans]MEC0484502.1 hypothetical protein [Bacillus glycinifermentans]MEC0496894.1 hypothetical protein [Bacillus glycinifermentans]MEC0539601.1 hypothetical protein [Bacillus glycinifermentans]MEC3608495.1 hypothetical protein [Bacillus glycinifermentans]UOY87692.1 hypothetical protein MW696_16690 [Bacillus glycinifermentans]